MAPTAEDSKSVKHEDGERERERERDLEEYVVHVIRQKDAYHTLSGERCLLRRLNKFRCVRVPKSDWTEYTV